MKKRLMRWGVLSTTLVLMAFTMPNCPGQEEMKSQISALEASKMDLTRKVQNLNTQVTTLNKDMTEVRQVLVQMTGVIQAQKGALEQMEATLAAMQQQMQAKSKGKKK